MSGVGGTTARPALVLAAHGSADPAARPVLDDLADAVRGRLPGTAVRLAVLQHGQPTVGDALAASGPGTVVVPLLLARGYHASTDIGRVAGAVGARVARPLGPDPLLADALADRLGQAGVRSGAPVVLAAAGSLDPGCAPDVQGQARLLAERVGAEVTVGYLSVASPPVAEAVCARLRRTGAPVAVAAYLLAPGRFADAARAVAATWVSDPLGAHPAVAELVAARYREAAGGRSVTPV